MSHRITMQDLKNVLRRLNDIAGQKQDAWEMLPDGGTHKSNPGTYIIDICYGGYRLGQICNESGGERDITGRTTKRELYHRMHAYIAGYETAKGEQTVPHLG